MEPTAIGAAAAPANERTWSPEALAAAAFLLVGAVVLLLAAPASYDVLKAVHVTFAAIWVGSGVGLTIMAILAIRAGSPQEIGTVARFADALGQFLFLPAGLVVFAFGVALVEKGSWGWGTAWVDIALAAWALSFLVGAAVLGPRSKRIHHALQASGGEVTPPIQAQITQIMAIARFDVAMLLLVVIDMAAKPTF